MRERGEEEKGEVQKIGRGERERDRHTQYSYCPLVASVPLTSISTELLSVLKGS
jgi:hypothetical protein